MWPAFCPIPAIVGHEPYGEGYPDGQGAYIDVRELKAAGGAPLKVGIAAGLCKYALALVVVLLFVSKEANF